MKYNVFSPASTLLLGLTVVCAAQGSNTPAQQEMRFATPGPHSRNIGYLLFLPRGYKASQQNWPLMLFLHGIGARGTNLASLKQDGPPKIVETAPGFPFILVSPQLSRGHDWNDDLLMALLNDVVGHYRVDTNRIYLTGLSMGGFGTWSLAAAHPETFAAVVPICGGGKPEDAVKLAALPIWVFHGAKDPTVPVRRSREMVEAIMAAGGHIKYTEYPEAGHDCWTQTYANPALYKWLLAQKR